MYSRNMNERGGSFTVPPGYDGSRFRRRRRHGADSADEVILIPDSGFAPAEEQTEDRAEDTKDGELSVSGIPTNKGRRYSASAEIDREEDAHDVSAPANHEEHSHKDNDRLRSILDKFGFGGGFTSDELLLLAIIFILASDSEDCGDVLLILALLLGLR